MRAENALFDQCKISLYNPLSLGRQYWCLLTAQIGEFDLVLILCLSLVLTGVPFSAWIVSLSEVVEGAQVWLIFFLVKYFCTRSDDKPGQDVKNFFVIYFTHPD